MLQEDVSGDTRAFAKKRILRFAAPTGRGHRSPDIGPRGVYPEPTVAGRGTRNDNRKHFFSTLLSRYEGRPSAARLHAAGSHPAAHERLFPAPGSSGFWRAGGFGQLYAARSGREPRLAHRAG